jgi:amino acid adenylation domain-containing protein
MTDKLLSGLDPEILALLWADESADPIIKKQNHTEGPLSFSQHHLWVLQQLDPEMTAYNMPRALLLEGPLNIVKLEGAFKQLINKQTVFRTQYLTVNDLPIQRITANVQFELETIALDIAAENEQGYLHNETVKTWFNRSFDLTSGALLRAAIVIISVNKNIVLIDYHHIASDAWSNGLILQDLTDAYAGKKLTALDTSYLDFAYWQNDYLTCDDSQTTKDYWLAYLTGDIQPLTLPIDFKQPTTQNFAGACSSIVLDEEKINDLKGFCQLYEVTPFMVLLATWQILLSRYSNQSDFAIGVPTASRNQAELQQIVGFFVNTQVYKAQVSPQLSVKQLIEKIRNHTLNILEQEQLPLEWLLNNLEISRSSNRSPLFQVLFDYKTEESLSAKMDDIVITPFEANTTSSKLELELNVLMEESQAQISLNYQTALFTQSTVENLLEEFSSLLTQVISKPLSHVGNLTLKSPGSVLTNASQHKYIAPVHQLIEQQVELTPNAIALVFEDEQLTYTELNQRANQLAHYLIAQDIKVEDKVGIAVERSVNMVVSLLAVLKVGAAYVPLDPDYPQERLAYIMQDSSIKVLLRESRKLSQSERVNNLPEFSTGVTLCIDQLALGNEKNTNPHVSLHSDNLAYLIYTSGSTGKPKGVMVRHHALSNFLQSMQEEPGLTSDDTLVAVTSLSFDIAALELYLPMLSGAKLVLATRTDVLEGHALAQLMDKHQATVLQSTPSGWRLLLASGWQPKGANVEGTKLEDKKLKALCGGEALPQDLAQELRSKGVDLWNMYGPTETTIWSAVKQLSNNVPTLGLPIADTQLHILDNELNPTPKGVAGELYISGSGLARGYSGRVDLTIDAFIANPFSEQGEQLYRTGDLVRWNNNGELEYLGRIDHQVKIRGFRIELGEIETALLSQESVHEAIVIAQKHQGNARLVAYVITSENSELDTVQLQSNLMQILPNYMVPALVIVLKALPITPNGKIDRKALPEPQFVSGSEYEEPVGEVEVILANIWAEVLGIERVGRHDNFFELGGHSLTAMQVSAMLNKRCGYEMPVRYLFEVPELKSLALLLPPELSEQQHEKSARIAKMASLFEEFEI